MAFEQLFNEPGFVGDVQFAQKFKICYIQSTFVKFSFEHSENQIFKFAIALANHPFCCSDSDQIKPLAMLAISDKIVSDHTSACIVFTTKVRN